METLVVNTIYPAFMGEVNAHGIGTPCTFIRLAGCNLRCYFKTKGILCDTPEALEMRIGKVMPTSEVVNKVLSLGRKTVCLTGGEPLMQDCRELLEELSNWGFYVVVETNGSKSIAKYKDIPGVSFVVDYKSTSTGEGSKMLFDNYRYMDSDDILKFVVDTKDDYDEMKRWIIANGSNFKGTIAVGLFWGSQMNYMELIQNLLEDDLQVYLNMQTHKMACMYDAFKKSRKFSKLFIPKNL